MEVFHGSDHIVKEPLYLGGKSDNDYGNGFYVTEDENSARSWAALNGNLEHSIVNKYELNLNELRILDLNAHGVLAWIAEVVANRESGPEYRNEDLHARREVGRFLSKSMKAVLLEGYQVTGVTARYALQNKLIYQKEGDFYE